MNHHLSDEHDNSGAKKAALHFLRVVDDYLALESSKRLERESCAPLGRDICILLRRPVTVNGPQRYKLSSNTFPYD